MDPDITNPFMRKTDDSNQVSSVRFLHPLQSLSKKTSSAESIKNTAHSPKFFTQKGCLAFFQLSQLTRKWLVKIDSVLSKNLMVDVLKLI